MMCCFYSMLIWWCAYFSGWFDSKMVYFKFETYWSSILNPYWWHILEWESVKFIKVVLSRSCATFTDWFSPGIYFLISIWIQLLTAIFLRLYCLIFFPIFIWVARVCYRIIPLAFYIKILLYVELYIWICLLICYYLSLLLWWWGWRVMMMC